MRFIIDSLPSECLFKSEKKDPSFGVWCRYLDFAVFQSTLYEITITGNYRLYTKDGLRDSSIGFWIPQVDTSVLALSCLNIELYDCENCLAYRHSAKQNSCLNLNNSISLDIWVFLLLTPRFCCDFSKRQKAKYRVCQKKCCRKMCLLNITVRKPVLADLQNKEL